MTRRFKDNSFGEKGGTSPTRGKKAMTYLCTHPDGGAPKKKRTFTPLKEPAAVWYKSRSDGGWHLNTVVDRSAMPRWVDHNYTVTEATPA